MLMAPVALAGQEDLKGDRAQLEPWLLCRFGKLTV